ncbi:MAG TPA: hypothetical protein VG147_13280 [Solirubrobacteraceae bacterium]|jgi:hypothetical protein|nr:hypothetical protein [Solirubrobacteraceae bacterium]
MLKLKTLAAAAALLACACLPAAAAAKATEKATLTTSFTPDRLGASTTVGFSFNILTTEGLAPPPLNSIDLHMPAGMNYTTTTLGLAICQPEVLAKEGLAGCPVNSRLGFGSAYVEVPFGDGAGTELPEIQAVMGPSHTGNIAVLFYANGKAPVSAQLVFKGEVEPASGAFGSQLTTLVPPIPSVPGGNNVAILSVKATIGPEGLTYEKHVHGKLVHFKPLGIGVPEHCPRGGFPFSASFTFEDGSATTASAKVPCPASHSSARRKK